MTVEIIADGIHLPKSLLQFVYKFKDVDKIILITDSMRGAGQANGESLLGSLKDGMKCIIEDGVAKLPDRSAFAGSVATADRLVRNMIVLAGATLPEAVKMITENPARLMKLNNTGTLEKDYLADIVIFDEEIHVKRTIVGGKTVFVS
ncbi:N-acetylglucosamine-6-phosphate deacetylase [bioreactor metagenome]|uniref:N-acetylglucosamine-6-phosphate deacetylase n=1 Tax=bioreactor metagenome TaxID=1076179 RepID=A0A645JF90_9ZZZZ